VGTVGMRSPPARSFAWDTPPWVADVRARARGHSDSALNEAGGVVRRMSVVLVLGVVGGAVWGLLCPSWWPFFAAASGIGLISLIASSAIPKRSTDTLAALWVFFGLGSLVGTIVWGGLHHQWAPLILWVCGLVVAGLIVSGIENSQAELRHSRDKVELLQRQLHELREKQGGLPFADSVSSLGLDREDDQPSGRVEGKLTQLAERTLDREQASAAMRREGGGK